MSLRSCNGTFLLLIVIQLEIGLEQSQGYWTISVTQPAGFSSTLKRTCFHLPQIFASGIVTFSHCDMNSHCCITLSTWERNCWKSAFQQIQSFDCPYRTVCLNGAPIRRVSITKLYKALAWKNRGPVFLWMLSGTGQSRSLKSQAASSRQGLFPLILWLTVFLWLRLKFQYSRVQMTQADPSQFDWIIAASDT